MCGIVGYVGWCFVYVVVMDVLCWMEYCGYDLLGIVLVDGGIFIVCWCVGWLVNFEEVVVEMLFMVLFGIIGLGYICWVIYGCFIDCNVYLYCDVVGKIVVVYNGIIENFVVLCWELEIVGVEFVSDIDIEVVVYLVVWVYWYGEMVDDFVGFVFVVLCWFEGYFMFVFVNVDDFGIFVVVCCFMFLVLGIGDNEMFVGFDVVVFIEYIWEVVEFG